MLIYTLFGSLPLLVGLLLLSQGRYNTWIFFTYKLAHLRALSQIVLLVAFLVKIPIYLFHLWLPKAHVEAPVAGSIILAGVLLKLGGYGILRVASMFNVSGLVSYDFIIMGVALVGSFYVGLICLRQVDVKSLIAYSSVCHIGLIIGGLISCGLWGSYGSLVLILGHGLCSSGLFCLANMVYERSFTRNIFILKGLMLIYPSIAVW